jgi:hypothetical protein
MFAARLLPKGTRSFSCESHLPRRERSPVRVREWYHGAVNRAEAAVIGRDEELGAMRDFLAAHEISLVRWCSREN